MSQIEQVEKGSVRLVVGDPSGAVARVDDSMLREMLEEKFSLHLFGVAPEHDVDELSELTAELLRASEDLLLWPTTLPSGERLDRPELNQLLSIVNENIRSVTALIGDPGSGKSALLATLGKKLADKVTQYSPLRPICSTLRSPTKLICAHGWTFPIGPAQSLPVLLRSDRRSS